MLSTNIFSSKFRTATCVLSSIILSIKTEEGIDMTAVIKPIRVLNTCISLSVYRIPVQSFKTLWTIFVFTSFASFYMQVMSTFSETKEQHSTDLTQLHCSPEGLVTTPDKTKEKMISMTKSFHRFLGIVNLTRQHVLKLKIRMLFPPTKLIKIS